MYVDIRRDMRRFGHSSLLVPNRDWWRFKQGSTGEGTTSYLTERLGSVLALADESGSLQTEYTYDPFGTTVESGAQNESPFGYTGRENDGTGLQYNRARYYSPESGRFISQDPLGMAGSGTNLYLYVGGDPLDATDPSGLLCIGVCISIPDPVALAEEAVSTVGEAVTYAEELASAAVSNFETSVSAAWGGFGALPGAVEGGIYGCGAGVAEQATSELGVPIAGEVIVIGSGARDIYKAGRIFDREAPWFREGVGEVLRTLF
jgi:RHS repeat-associated protein